MAEEDDKQLSLVLQEFKIGEFTKAEAAAMKGIKMRLGKHQHHPELFGLLAQIKAQQKQSLMASKFAEKALEGWHTARNPNNPKYVAYLRTLVAAHHLTSLDLTAARPFLDAAEPQREDLTSESDVTEHDVRSVLRNFMAHEPSRKDLRGKILDRISHCKPALTKQITYDPIGTEAARSLVDEKLMSGDGPFELFMAGPGDGRHLFASMIEAEKLSARRKEEEPDAATKRLHFIVCDHHPSTIARLLLMLQVVEMAVHEQKEEDRALLVASLAYIFSSVIVPECVAEVIRSAASYVNYALHNWGDRDANPFLGYIRIPQSAREDIATAVSKWWEPSDQALTGQIMNEVVKQLDHKRYLLQKDKRYYGASHTPCSLGSQSENEISASVGIFGPPKCFADRDSHNNAYDDQDQGGDKASPDWRLYEMIRNYHIADKQDGVATTQNPKLDQLINAMRYHVVESWRANTTLLFGASATTSGIASAQTSFSLPLFGGCFGVQQLLATVDPTPRADPESLTKAFDAMVSFFARLTDSLPRVKEIITMDFAIGDAVEIMERLRQGSLAHEVGADNPTSKFDPRLLDLKFDLIDLSNVADDTNRPRLRFSVWEGSMSYTNIIDYLNEFLALQRHSLVSSVYGIDIDEGANSEDNMSSSNALVKQPLHMGRPMTWKKLSPTDLHTVIKADEQKWLSFMLDQHLLTLCLPPQQRAADKRASRQQRTHALNLSSYFRLVANLNDRKFDYVFLHSHVVRALSEKIETKARFPSRNVIWSFHEPEMMSGAYMHRGLKEIDLRPWRAELTTLAIIWQRLLNFSIVMEKLVLGDIGRFEMVLKSPEACKLVNAQAPEFILVFIKRMEKTFSGPVLSDVLSGGESPKDSELADKIRGNCHIITSWKWNEEYHIASFWMREDVVAGMMRSLIEWDVWVYRTDDWDEPVYGPDCLEKAQVRKCESWLRGTTEILEDDLDEGFAKRWKDEGDKSFGTPAS